jgi:hypothetical protein
MFGKRRVALPVYKVKKHTVDKWGRLPVTNEENLGGSSGRLEWSLAEICRVSFAHCRTPYVTVDLLVGFDPDRCESTS